MRAPEGIVTMHLALLEAESDPLWERLLVAATGPLVTVIIGGLVVWGITYKVQQDRADRIRLQDLARADAAARQARADRDEEIRHELVTSMTQAAGALYLTTQHYWRAKRRSKDTRTDDGKLQEQRDILDATYLDSRRSGEIIENRLQGYFTTSAPRDLWHAVMDILTVRYFQLIDQATPNLYALNAGPQHSGMKTEEMENPDKLLSQYQLVLKEAVQSVFDTSLRKRSDIFQEPPVDRPPS
jgi:hypothetical protein